MISFKLCLKDIINDLKTSGTWKIPLTIAINFISSKNDNYEERKMHLKKHEIVMNDEADENIGELFESFRKRYYNKFEESIKGNDSVFDYLHLCIINVIESIRIVVDHI